MNNAVAFNEGVDKRTARQSEVLDAALDLLVSEGTFSMSRLAASANCSKETLYRWFGDRDGVMRATVGHQAARVKGSYIDLSIIDCVMLGRYLTDLAADWLLVLSGRVSVALNRLAISEADGGAGLGQIVLDAGRNAISARLKPVLRAANDAGIVSIDDEDAAFSTLFGLVVRDRQIRLLLGETLNYDKQTIYLEARRATEQFLTLYSAEKINPNIKP